jgi:superfamily II DNA or RNA helicase
VTGAVFIFDEQRLVGNGAWVKSFLKIARTNRWILLSATPGDKWEDYIPVFIANGFYKNRSQFKVEHMVLKPYMKFPVVDHYVGTKKLKYYANQVLVTMNYEHEIKKHQIDILCEYDKEKYKKVFKDRWDPYENCPIEETGKLCYLLRRVSNEHISRFEQLEFLIELHHKLIVFYNFTYELHALREFFEAHGYSIGEWNGEKHTPIPEGDKWVYLCQYTAASEGWNAISTDTMIFFSQNYSYKTTEQAAGRIDRLNTPFKELYYYYFRSASPIDLAIRRALKQKKTFNERIFMRGVQYDQSNS